MDEILRKILGGSYEKELATRLVLDLRDAMKAEMSKHFSPENFMEYFDKAIVLFDTQARKWVQARVEEPALLKQNRLVLMDILEDTLEGNIVHATIKTVREMTFSELINNLNEQLESYGIPILKRSIDMVEWKRNNWGKIIDIFYKLATKIPARTAIRRLEKLFPAEIERQAKQKEKQTYTDWNDILGGFAKEHFNNGSFYANFDFDGFTEASQRTRREQTKRKSRTNQQRQQQHFNQEQQRRQEPPPSNYRRGRMSTYEAYQTLGINQGVDRKQMISAFRKLVFKYHPDTGENGGNPEMFNKITEAKELLETIL